MCTITPSESFPVDAQGWVISKGDFVALYEPFPESGEIDTNAYKGKEEHAFIVDFYGVINPVDGFADDKN